MKLAIPWKSKSSGCSFGWNEGSEVFFMVGPAGFSLETTKNARQGENTVENSFGSELF